MQTLKVLSKLGICLFIATALYGCSLTPDSTPSVETNTGLGSQKFNQLVSRDVASVLRQIASLAPEFTTLGLSRDTVQQDEFAAALDCQLQAIGYAMRSIGSSPDTIPVSYSFVKVPANERNASDVFAQVVTVRVGDVAVRRSYAMDINNNVRPLGDMSVRGADASLLVKDDEIFTPIGPKPEDTRQKPQSSQLVAGVQNTQTNQSQFIGKQTNNLPSQNNLFTNNTTVPGALVSQLPRPKASAPELSGNEKSVAC